MNFNGTIRQIDVIDPQLLSNLKEHVDRDFSTKWVRRTLNLMPDSYCLKAITPSQIDVLDSADAEHLRELLVPLVTPYVKPGEKLVYLDINNLPAKAECLPHIDHALMHVLSRRLHIPLWTNPNAHFALRSREGNKNFNLGVGNVYEVNNQILHAVGNYGKDDRWHIIIDVMDEVIHDQLLKSGRLFSIAVDGIINFSYDPNITIKLMDTLRSPPEAI
jgi:hypothetical protein